MLLEGGDTDTNAAIVGGMIGAYQGLSSIPEDWVDAVIETHEDNDRPDFLKTHSKDKFFPLIDQLLENAPNDENLIID